MSNASAMPSPNSAKLLVAGREVTVEGHAGASPRDTLVMIHGWPDTQRVWDGTVAALADRWRCVRFTLPGFDAGDEPRAHSLADITELIHQVVRHAGGGAPVTLVLHDWGCLYGYHFANQHPELVARIVGVDIGDATSRAMRESLGAKAKAMVVFYQGWLALAWRVRPLSRRLTDGMARWMARMMHVRTPQPEIRAAMGYPYWITWSGQHGSHRAMRTLQVRWPVLFAYGERKPLMFHSPVWATELAAQPGCRVLGFHAGHWVMLDAAAEFHAAVREWLEATT
jgi:cis-3-alkyl-4-acyloxetan-2-one decarboxylase